MNFQATALALSCWVAASLAAQVRPPAVPLVTHDPYFSVWSMTDRLTDGWPKHWTGSTMGMAGLVRIDGKTYRWCGLLPESAPAMEQMSLEVDWLETRYRFEAAGVRLDVAFNSPIGLAESFDVSSRPVSIIRAQASSTDGREHEIQFYVDVSAEWCVHSPDQRVSWSRSRIAGMQAVSMGTVEQPVLARAGDWARIDWGRLVLAAPANRSDAAAVDVVTSSHNTSRRSFLASGTLPDSDDTRMPRPANDDWPVLAATIRLGKVGSAPKSASLLLAYDDGFGIELFERRLRPYWARDSSEISTPMKAVGDAIAAGTASEPARQNQLSEKARAIGGEPYERLLKLAFRQVMAGHKIVADWDGTPLMFSKENTSNGCIATVDVIYPACPFFLVHNPAMLRAQLLPLMNYAQSPRWKFPFAPHDLGTYPKANGQVYGGGERTEENQMPVEESGNMLIMLAALVKVEGNADFSKPYLPMLARWAEYLAANGLDPANQLCTDDFAGHLARNANLSAKTVVALGGYAQILAATGDREGSERWMTKAREFATKWRELAKDGDSTVLVFGTPGTWSQKYNLVWDRVLGLGLFPQDVLDREMKLYRSKMQKYGLPLDSRKTYTKTDWTVWSACLSGRRADFDAIMGPVYTWVNEGPSRVPLTDWYETTDGRTMGMHTRTVVGGIWMPLLLDRVGAGLN